MKSTKPCVTDPPILQCIGDASTQVVDLYSFVDEEPLFCAPASEAVLLLLAAYYVFDIAYAPSSKLPLTLLAAILLQEVCAKEITKLLSVSNVLAKLRAT